MKAHNMKEISDYMNDRKKNKTIIKMLHGKQF